MLKNAVLCCTAAPPFQDAIDKYHLQHLRLEFFVNACDHPMSFFSSHWPGRAGFPVLSTGVTADTMDIAVPDALDLDVAYSSNKAEEVRAGWKEAGANYTWI